MKTKMVIALVLVGLVTGCGGGSGGSTASAPPPAPVKSSDTFQIKTAYSNYLLDQGSQPFGITGTYNSKGVVYPVTGSGRATWGTLTSSSWEGVFAYSKASTVTGNVTINGTTTPLSGTSYTFVDANYNPLGYSGTEYVDVTSYNPVPVTAKVDYSAEWYKANVYSSSAKSSITATRTTSMTLEPDTEHTAIMVIISTDKETLGGSTGYVTSARFRITPAGLITRISESATDYFLGSPYKTVTITYQ